MTAIVIVMTNESFIPGCDLMASAPSRSKKPLNIPTSIDRPEEDISQFYEASCHSKSLVFLDGRGFMAFAGSILDARRLATYLVDLPENFFSDQSIDWKSQIADYIDLMCNDLQCFVAIYNKSLNCIDTLHNAREIKRDKIKVFVLGSGTSDIIRNVECTFVKEKNDDIAINRFPITFLQGGIYNQRMTSVGLKDRWGAGGEIIEFQGERFVNIDFSFYAYGLKQSLDGNNVSAVGGMFHLTVPSSQGRYLLTKTPKSCGIFAIDNIFEKPLGPPDNKTYRPNLLFTSAYRRDQFGSETLQTHAGVIDNHTVEAIKYRISSNKKMIKSVKFIFNSNFWKQHWSHNADYLGLIGGVNEGLPRQFIIRG